MMPLTSLPKLLVASVVLYLLAIGCMRSAEKQESLVDCIRTAGGEVGYARTAGYPVLGDLVSDLLGDDYVYSVESVVLNGPSAIGDDKRVLRCVGKLKDLKKLVIEDVAVGSDFLAEVAKMHDLRQLWLIRVNLKDADLATFADLSHVHSLHLDHNPISDTGIKHVASLPSLVELSLSGTRSSAKSLQELSRTDLQYLWIDRTCVEIQDLDLLKDLPKLETVFVSASMAPEEAIRRVDEKIPAAIVPINTERKPEE